MASIIFSKDVELIEELKQENERFVKKSIELEKSSYRYVVLEELPRSQPQSEPRHSVYENGFVHRRSR